MYDKWDEEWEEGGGGYLSEKWEMIKSGDWQGLLEDKKFVAGVLLLILGLGILIYAFIPHGGGEATTTSTLSTVCVETPDGKPIPDATIITDLTSAKTGEDGCASVEPSDHLEVKAVGFEPYNGDFTEEVVLQRSLS
jgi:hypothetical protein